MVSLGRAYAMTRLILLKYLTRIITSSCTLLIPPSFLVLVSIPSCQLPLKLLFGSFYLNLSLVIIDSPCQDILQMLFCLYYDLSPLRLLYFHLVS